MCTTCGCSYGAKATITNPGTGEAHPIEADHEHGHHHYGHDHGDDQHDDHHHHHHAHHHHHHGAPGPGHGATVSLEEEVLAKNNRLAERNRGWFEGRRILALNLVSSPGAGKTTLLERTIGDLLGEVSIAVVEGDQETVFDAERIRATGCATVQVNTGTGCHLEADMLARALEELDPPLDSLVMIENVGNLVCPALFDLGERAKVAVLSVTEGADKPLKYPHMFRASSLLIINKVDLMPYVEFDLDQCIEYARRVNPDIEVLALSATRGTGLEDWYQWLRERMAKPVRPTATYPTGEDV